MQTLNVSQAREKLPKLMEEVFMNSKTYLITRRGIPMIKLIKADIKSKGKPFNKKNNKKLLKFAGKIKGIWSEENWKNKSSTEVVNFLRGRSQKTYVR